MGGPVILEGQFHEQGDARVSIKPYIPTYLNIYYTYTYIVCILAAEQNMRPFYIL